MPWQRLVGRLQSLARANPAAFYGCSARYSRPVQIRSACPWYRDLFARSELPSFHLDEKNETHLAGLYCGDARRDWAFDGTISVRARDDRDEYRSLRRYF